MPRYLSDSFDKDKHPVKDVAMISNPAKEDVLIDSLAIRDTNPVTSPSSKVDGQTGLIMYCYNNLNQSVNMQYQYSRDNVSWVNIGSPASLTNGTAAFRNSGTDSALQAKTGYLRVTATASVAPTTGTILIALQKAGISV